jgi:hypothetical protein
MERNDIRMADFVQLLNNGMLNANNMKAGLGSKRFNYFSLHPVYSIIFSGKFLEKNMICIFRESLPGSSSRKNTKQRQFIGMVQVYFLEHLHSLRPGAIHGQWFLHVSTILYMTLHVYTCLIMLIPNPLVWVNPC